MKCTGKDKVVIDAQFVQTLSKVALIDQSTGLVDNYKRVDDPVGISLRSQERDDISRLKHTLLRLRPTRFAGFNETTDEASQ